MKSMKWITTSMAALLLLLIASPLMGQLGKVHGTATEDGEALPGYSVRLRAFGAEVRRGMTDLQGKYEFALLQAGSYEVEVEENGVLYRQAFVVAPGETRPLPIDISKAMAFDAEGNRIYRNTGTRITESLTPLFTVDPVTPQVVTGDDLRRMPDRGLQAAISQIALMNSGMPAEFGDATGGVILITTHNPGMKPYVGSPLSKAERKSIRARQKATPKGAGLPTDAPAHALS